MVMFLLVHGGKAVSYFAEILYHTAAAVSRAIYSLMV